MVLPVITGGRPVVGCRAPISCRQLSFSRQHRQTCDQLEVNCFEGPIFCCLIFPTPCATQSHPNHWPQAWSSSLMTYRVHFLVVWIIIVVISDR